MYEIKLIDAVAVQPQQENNNNNMIVNQEAEQFKFP